MTAESADPFELVIFDCDGVLVDSERLANAVFSKMLNQLGLKVTLDDMYRDFMGLSVSDCLQVIEDRLGKPPPTDFFAELNRQIRAAFHLSLNPVDGITEALDRISIPYCVASSGDHEKMNLTLGLTGLLERFDGRIYSVTQVARGKPHPDVFLFAAERMGATPSRTAVVEDTAVGVRAGVAAGMTVFGYAGLSDPEKLSAAGAHVFDDMTLLPDLLQLKKSDRLR